MGSETGDIATVPGQGRGAESNSGSVGETIRRAMSWAETWLMEDRRRGRGVDGGSSACGVGYVP